MKPNTNFDWSKWDSKWKWAAKDESGSIYIYTDKPETIYSGWWATAGLDHLVQHSSVFIEGDWKESLISREEMEKAGTEGQKFKVGDRVKVIRKSSNHSLWWTRGMDRTIDMVGEVIHVTEYVSHTSIRVGIDCTVWSYLPSSLELVVEESGNGENISTENPSAFTEDNFKLFIKMSVNREQARTMLETFKTWLHSRKPVNINEQRAKGFLESKGYKVEKC